MVYSIAARPVAARPVAAALPDLRLWVPGVPRALDAMIDIRTTAADAATAWRHTRDKAQALIDACTAAGVAPADVALVDSLSAPAGTVYRAQASVRVVLRDPGDPGRPGTALAAAIAADRGSLSVARLSARP
jgi:hypothetical protein